MKQTIVGIAVCALLAACAWGQALPHPLLPDKAMTPGVMNPAVTQGNIKTTICDVAWVKAQRPPTNYTTPLKLASLSFQKITEPAKDFEWDHLFPIEGGGHPRDKGNMWTQFWPIAREKDIIENAIHKGLCGGTIKLVDVPGLIWNWPALYEQKTGKKAQ
jgi:hypothetical protein